MHLHRHILITLLTAAALIGAAAPASAGTYVVQSCQTTGAYTANNLWTWTSSGTSAVTSSSVCPPASDAQGLRTLTVLSNPTAPVQNDFAEWRVTAPTSTTITRVEARRDWTLQGGSGWIAYGRSADGTAAEGCNAADGLCTPGDSGGYNGQYEILTGLNTSSFAYGIRCGRSSCTTGSSILAADMRLWGSRITITDNTVPTASGATGALLAGGYLRGDKTVSFAASDSTGIASTRLYADGAQRSTGPARTCNYGQAAPCSNLTAGSETVTLNTAALADGTHTVQLAGVDPAGNEGRTSAATITTDNTAPTSPVPGASVGSGWQRNASPSFSWSLPGGQVAPITAAELQRCPSGNSSGCTNVPTSGLTAASDTPGDGVWDYRVRLTDQAGNVGAYSAVTTVRIDTAAPAAPQGLTIAARDASAPTFTATWANPASSAPITSASWRLCPADFNTVCTSGTTTDSSITTALPGYGNWVFDVTVTDAAGNTSPTPATASITLTNPTPAPAAAAGAAPTAAPAASSAPTTSTPPVVPTSTPRPTSTPTTTPTAAKKATPSVKITRPKLTSKTVSVRVQLPSKASGKVRVTYSAKVAGKTRRQVKTYTLRGGKVTASLRLTSTLRKARKGTLTIRYAGNSRYKTRTVVRTVRR